VSHFARFDSLVEFDARSLPLGLATFNCDFVINDKVRVSVGVSRLKPAAPTVERATVRTDTVKRDPMLRQMRGSRQIPADTEATVVRIHMQYQGPFERSWKAIG
jgi:hypothetical protein